MIPEPPAATVVVVPRDSYAPTRRCLERLLECTPEPRRIVIVDGGSPPPVAAYLESAAREHDLTLLRCDHVLTPNEARNLGARHVATDWLAFVDNDVSVEPGWLDRLVASGEETGAAAVGPLVGISDGDPRDLRVHFAGGDCGLRDAGGRTRLWERNYAEPQARPDGWRQDERRECGLFEFHAVLVRRAALAEVGPLDEGLRSMLEHLDLALSLRVHGGSVWYEPSVTVSYVPPRSPRGADLAFYVTRWSDEWNERSGERFAEKWGLHQGDERLGVNVEFGAWVRTRAYRPYRSPVRVLAPRRRRVPRPVIDRVAQRRALRGYRRRVLESGPSRVVHAASWMEAHADV